MLLLHGFLNLFRNKRRVAMVLLLLIVALIIPSLINAYVQGLLTMMRRVTIEQRGSFQVARKGYWDETREKSVFLTREDIDKLRTFLSSFPKIRNIDEDVFIQGLIGTATQSSTTSGIGVDPDVRNRGASSLWEERSGRWLEKGDVEEVLLGDRLARYLGVKPGDWLNILATTAEGVLNPVSAKVKGTVAGWSREANKRVFLLPKELARSILAIRGAERLLVYHSGNVNDAEIRAAQEKLEKEIARRGWPVETRRWDQLSSFFDDLKRMYTFLFRFVVIIVTLLSVIAISEFIAIAFLERMREIGSLRAIGHTRLEIFRLLLIEVSALFFVAVLLAIPLGLGIAHLLNAAEISYRPPNAAQAVFFYFDPSVKHFFIPAVVLFFTSLAAGIFPAIKSARLRVVEVLKHE